jgi:acetyl esterase/lipase
MRDETRELTTTTRRSFIGAGVVATAYAMVPVPVAAQTAAPPAGPSPATTSQTPSAAPAPAAPAVRSRQTIQIWPEGVPGRLPNGGPERIEDGRVSDVQDPTIDWYPAPAGTATGTCVVVCPGGGYARLAIGHEGNGVAAFLNGIGVTAFVLKYRLRDYGHPAPLRDVLRAIRLVRARAAEFSVRPGRIGVMGSSAGGHLAGCAATLYDAPEGRTGASLDSTSARPDFATLLYPVVTMTDVFGHAGSRRNLLGESPTPDLIARLSVELQVTPSTPPCFLVHTAEDKTVPIENSLAFYMALRRANVPVEMHLYETGPHGFGLRAGLGPTSEWPLRWATWMTSHGWLA